MSTTVREIQLKIKADIAAMKGQGGMSGGGFKEYVGHAGRLTKAVKEQAPLLATANRLWMEHAKAIGAAASALQKYNNARMPKEPTASRAGGGGSGGGGIGLASFGRFAPHALAATAGALAFNEARSAAPHLWAASLHGGPVRRGAFPILDSAIDTITGRDQREWMEDIRQGWIDRNLRHQASVRGAGQSYRQGMHQLQRSMLSSAATPHERTDLLGRQRGELRNDLEGLRREQRNLEAEYSARGRELEMAQERARNRPEHAAIGAARKFSGAMDKVPWAAGVMNPILGMGKLMGFGADLGIKLGEEGAKDEASAALLQQQLEAAKKMQENLQAQQRTLEAILSNEQQQLELARSIAQQRTDAAVSFGSMTPTEQRVAVSALQTLNRGGTITSDEQAILGRTGPVGQRALRNAYFQNAGPLYDDFLRTGQQGGYVTGEEIGQRRQAMTGAALAQGAFGALGVNLPTVEVTLKVDEELLARAIARETEGTLKDIKVVTKQLAEQVNRLESATAGRAIQSGTSLAGAALGRK